MYLWCDNTHLWCDSTHLKCYSTHLWCDSTHLRCDSDGESSRRVDWQHQGDGGELMERRHTFVPTQIFLS